MDLDQRKTILAAMYETKLLAVSHFMNERTRYLDMRVAQQHVEQFDLPEGSSGVIATDVTQFEECHSLHQVYEAFMFFVTNQEISISEKLGILTVHESEDVEKTKFCQARLLSSVIGTIEIESNIVMFVTCVEATADTPAFMLGTIDFVEQDDLYPYRSETCLRKSSLVP